MTVRAIGNPKSWPSNQDFVTAKGVNNIVLTGGGVIDGNGYAWPGFLNKSDSSFRPGLVSFQSTTNVLFTGINFLNSANHNLEMYSDFTEFDNITVIAPGESHNTDAVDVHGQPFYIHDSHLSVGDDNIAAHANDTLVEDCTFGTGHGASIGSVDDGYVRNVTFRGITFNGTVQAMRIKTDLGGVGYVKDCTWENLVLYGVSQTFVVTMNYSSLAGPTDMFISNITLRNITAYNGGSPGYFECLSSNPCTDFLLEDVVHHNTPGNFQCAHVYGTSTNVVPTSCVGPQ